MRWDGVGEGRDGVTGVRHNLRRGARVMSGHNTQPRDAIRGRAPLAQARRLRLLRLRLCAQRLGRFGASGGRFAALAASPIQQHVAA
eukprot:3994205-Prymnesium_polylepis.3